jgi:ferredoxin-NADP reductase
MGPPKGLFTLTPNDSRTHLLVSAGTGIAPFISMLSRLSSTSISVVVVHGVSFEAELAYRPWLESLAAARPNVVYAPTVSRPDAPENAAWEGRSGRVEQVLAAVSTDLRVDPAATIAYLCGNPDMVERSRDVLRGLGLADADIIRENYWAPTPTRAG